MERDLRRSVLITGGAGYIGAHTAKALHERGLRPVVYDNLSSGFRQAVGGGELIEGDVRDRRGLSAAMRAHGVSAVIHFAGLIEVARSAAEPERFWDHNVGGTAALLEAMREQGVRRLVFSSSAAVYGHGAGGPLEALDEAAPKAPVSPYGETKLEGERLIMAECAAHGLSALALRYFNAAGADPGGEIGEAHEPETHLIPLAIAAALGDGPSLTLFGDDFATPDGTCLRDYVHVCDLADAHLAALEADMAAGAFEAMNLGTGAGYSVRQVLEAVGRAVGQPVPYSIGARRAGDPASLVADAGLVRRRLGWAPKRSDLDQIVSDALRWERAPAYGAGRRALRPGIA
jgi:UDP-glucose-4-epimerase GalE